MSRRLGPDVLLAVVLPVACALVLLLLHPHREQPGREPAVEAPLTSAAVVCPAAIPGGTDSVGVTTLGDTKGEVTVGLGATTTPLALRPNRVAAASGAGPLVVAGADALAPGLVAGRAQTTPLAAVDCAPPQPDQWFTAAGADATHDSVVELVNPNTGPAVADITVRSPGGPLDVPALRGVTVPGGSSTTLDLGAITPRRGELSLEVHTSRGRLAVHVLDTYDELGAGARSQDWLPSQTAPARSNLLLGLAAGPGERTLVLTNPGADEVRAELQVVTPTAVFAPAGVEPVRVAPGSTEAVSLDDVLAEAVAQGAIGVRVTSTGEVTAGLRQVVGGDLALLAAAPPVATTTAAVVPPGASRLLLAGADAAGAATVTAYSVKGKELATQRVELTPDAGADVALPAGTTLVVLTPEQTSVRAAVLATGTGVAVVPLRELVLTGRVPDVRPGVP